MEMFSTTLKALREKKRLTRAEFAVRCNMSTETIRSYESNRRFPPNVIRLYVLINGLGLTKSDDEADILADAWLQQSVLKQRGNNNAQ